jgi:hypothetical protein
MANRIAVLGVLACLAPLLAWGQAGDRRSLEYLLKNAPPKADEGKLVNANLPELVTLRMSQLEEDLNLTPAQLPQWNAYRGKVQGMIDDIKRGPRVSASETTAPKRLDGLADTARNRLAAVEDIVDAGKALYAVLTPAQREVADRRLALPLATLTGVDAGSVEMRARPESAAK